MEQTYNDFNEGVILEKIKKLSDEYEEISRKDDTENRERLKALRYAQFIQGLKLSTGYGRRSLW